MGGWVRTAAPAVRQSCAPELCCFPLHSKRCCSAAFHRLPPYRFSATFCVHPSPAGCIFTYNGTDVDGTPTQGGYSTHYVVNKK